MPMMKTYMNHVIRHNLCTWLFLACLSLDTTYFGAVVTSTLSLTFLKKSSKSGSFSVYLKIRGIFEKQSPYICLMYFGVLVTITFTMWDFRIYPIPQEAMGF